MSWQQAKQEAARWVDRMQLPKSMRGQSVNLSERSRDLKFSGVYRLMVLRAAKRALAARGIIGWLDEADAKAEGELEE